MSRRVPLTPCDYLYLTHHQVLQRSVRSGSIAFLMVDAEGHVAPDRVRQALASTVTQHPVCLAPLAISTLTGRPHWRVPRAGPQAPLALAERVYRFDDLSASPDWAPRFAEAWHTGFLPHWDLSAGPNIRLHHFSLPDDRTRFCLHWPHFLMDAEGAQLLLGRLHDKRSESKTGRADGPRDLDGGLQSRTAPDGPPLDVLTDVSLLRRLRLFRRGFGLNKDGRGLAARPLFDDAAQTVASYGEDHRNWQGEQVRRIQAQATSLTPAGPALYARYLAACTIRALHRVYQEAGVQTDAYLITLPLRVTLKNPDGTPLRRRPIPGNYLVSPIICGRRELVDDGRALAADILRQLEAYRRADGDLVQWTMVWAASYLRASWYPLLFKLRLGFETLSSGFSYVHAMEQQGAEIAGAPIADMWYGGPLATPPGWNPVFTRFRDRVNLSLTWNRPGVADDVARRYAELIEQEVLGNG